MDRASNLVEVCRDSTIFLRLPGLPLGGGFGVTRPVAEYWVEDVGVSSGQDIMA